MVRGEGAARRESALGRCKMGQCPTPLFLPLVALPRLSSPYSRYRKNEWGRGTGAMDRPAKLELRNPKLCQNWHVGQASQALSSIRGVVVVGYILGYLGSVLVLLYRNRNDINPMQCHLPKFVLTLQLLHPLPRHRLPRLGPRLQSFAPYLGWN